MFIHSHTLGKVVPEIHSFIIHQKLNVTSSSKFGVMSGPKPQTNVHL